MTTISDPWHTGGVPFLSIASMWPATRALGPGIRAVVWVQGCCFHCPGCIAPEWIPFESKHLVRPTNLAEQIARIPDIDGITLSGGEPMLQAAGLAQMLDSLRCLRDLSVICFTGFTLERLQSAPPGPGVPELLKQVDVLIDGAYVATEDDDLGLRGSRNQRFHHLTSRFSGFDFANRPRTAEVYIEESLLRLVGIPPKGITQVLNRAIALYTPKRHLPDSTKETRNERLQKDVCER